MEKKLLNVTGSADVVRYECETNQVVFRPTMMFQTRGYKFTVTNSGGNTLSYDWELKNKNIKGSTLQISKGNKGPVSIDCSFNFTSAGEHSVGMRLCCAFCFNGGSSYSRRCV